MVKYILIAILDGFHEQGLMSAEFNSYNACTNAGNAIMNELVPHVFSSRYAEKAKIEKYKFICVSKGGE